MGLLDLFEPRPRSDRTVGYRLWDNLFGIEDDTVTPGERLVGGINSLASGLLSNPLGLLGGAAQGVKADLDNLMFEGGAMQRPEAVLGYAAAPMAPGAAGLMRNAPNVTNAITAYHGSPHSFDKFSMDKIGTGEGAQDLGRGMYFYDDEGAARLYQNPASRHGDLKAMRRYEEMGPGATYEVNINARPEQLLDVKTPAAELPDGSRMAARRDAKIAAETDPAFRQTMKDHMRVQNIMDGAEKDLLADGFVGMKRKRYGGETEMVVFDENLIEIVKKYGIAGAAVMLGVSAADVREAMNGT